MAIGDAAAGFFYPGQVALSLGVPGVDGLVGAPAADLYWSAPKCKWNLTPITPADYPPITTDYHSLHLCRVHLASFDCLAEFNWNLAPNFLVPELESDEGTQRQRSSDARSTAVVIVTYCGSDCSAIGFSRISTM